MTPAEQLRALYPDVCVIESGLIDLIRSSEAGLTGREDWDALQGRLGGLQKRYSEIRRGAIAAADENSARRDRPGGSVAP